MSCSSSSFAKVQDLSLQKLNTSSYIDLHDINPDVRFIVHDFADMHRPWTALAITIESNKDDDLYMDANAITARMGPPPL